MVAGLFIGALVSTHLLDVIPTIFMFRNFTPYRTIIPASVVVVFGITLIIALFAIHVSAERASKANISNALRNL
jgi:ABC-type lipoprotein release transport system permease subunit